MLYYKTPLCHLNCIILASSAHLLPIIVPSICVQSVRSFLPLIMCSSMWLNRSLHAANPFDFKGTMLPPPAPSSPPSASWNPHQKFVCPFRPIRRLEVSSLIFSSELKECPLLKCSIYFSF